MLLPRLWGQFCVRGSVGSSTQSSQRGTSPSQVSLSCHWAILLLFMMTLVAVTVARGVRTFTFPSGATRVSPSDMGSPSGGGPPLASAWRSSRESVSITVVFVR